MRWLPADLTMHHRLAWIGGIGIAVLKLKAAVLESLLGALIRSSRDLKTSISSVSYLVARLTCYGVNLTLRIDALISTLKLSLKRQGVYAFRSVRTIERRAKRSSALFFFNHRWHWQQENGCFRRSYKWTVGLRRDDLLSKSLNLLDRYWLFLFQEGN